MKLIPKETEPEQEQIDKLNTYVNKPHIRSIIIEKDLTNPKKNPGKVIVAAIANNPNNYVYGPSSEHRGSDPGGSRDDELLGAQSPEYKNDVGTYEANKSLDTFGNIRPTKPVDWEPKIGPKNSTNKYYVKKP